MELLSVSSDSKTVKGEKRGYLTGILYLSPANESGLQTSNGAEVNLCPFATAGCKASCLFTAGRGVFSSVRNARNARTRRYSENYEEFAGTLARDIARLQKRAKKLGLIPCVRVNGTSDQPKLALRMAELFPEVQFYDYSKLPRPWERSRANYDLTFSASESNHAECREALAHGCNVAVVFDTKRGRQLPAKWLADEFGDGGYDVIDGDESDLRFLDRKGVVVGLRAKGRAKKDATGFVRRESNQLVQIGAAA